MALPVLKKGSRGPNVEVAQYLLRHHGFDPQGIDGIFGDDTEDAVRRFQDSRRLVSDGIVGERTWTALFVGVQRGMKGDHVKAVQSKLKDLRFYDGRIDGDFDKDTEDAVEDFQKAQDLETDGIVGPKTWRALVIAKR